MAEEAISEEAMKNLRKNISSAFRLNGLSIKGDACSCLCQQLLPVTGKDRETWLCKIIESIQRNPTLNDPIVQVNHVMLALEECCKAENDFTDEIIHVINAFDIPLFEYNIESKKFFKSKQQLDVIPPASAKPIMFRNRYTILKQRLERHELLNKNETYTLDTEQKRDGPRLCTIDSLLSSSSSETVETIVLGMMSQIKEGKYFLEDLTGMLPIEIDNNTIYHPGLFTENCFVLAEGNYSDGIFRVQGLAHPPTESSEVSRTYYRNVNAFGGLSETSLKYSSKIIKLEQESEGAMIVFVADVFLDRIDVLQKIKILFDGFEEETPSAIVLMGNFLSTPRNDRYFDTLRAKFNELADIITRYKNLSNETLFVIVPGPTDSPAVNILPRPPLPDYIMDEFKRKVPKCAITTNPCRIQYYTQEIVVIREDILTKMSRNAVHLPATEDIPNHFARTILSQSHLIPLPLSVCPIYWNYDHCLSLYPLPDLVVVADQMSSFAHTYKNTTVANPSSFSKRRFIFKVYVPSTKQIQDSQIPDV